MSTNEETGLIPVDDKKKFRIQSSRVFITFPQCETTPEDAAQKINESPKTQSCRYVIAQENHKDGHKHLHLYIEKPKGFNFHDANYFDFITGKAVCKLYKKMKLNTIFDATGGTIADITTGALCLVVIAESTDATAQYNYYVRTRYVDV